MTEDDELDDGATEVVSGRPARDPSVKLDGALIAEMPAGGRLSAGDVSGESMVIRTSLGSARIMLSHAPAFKALWRLWTAKRVAGADDPGASAPEIAEAAKLDIQVIRRSLTSLMASRLLRSAVTHVGYHATRTRYYPTELGVQAFALADVLGAGASIQIGRTQRAWQNRAKDEPGDLFSFAALLRGTPLSETSENV